MAKKKSKKKVVRKSKLVLPPLSEVRFYAFLPKSEHEIDSTEIKLTQFNIGRIAQVVSGIPENLDEGTERREELRELLRDSGLHRAWTRANQIKLIVLLYNFDSGQFGVHEDTLNALTEAEREKHDLLVVA